MLGNISAAANIAVKDLKTARTFYKDVLGLTEVDTEREEVIVFKSGQTRIIVYRSEFAGTNKATAMSWDVGGDLEKIVQSLKSQGITFEHYEMPGMTRRGDIHIGGPMRVAWFKDPDGNILNLYSKG
jgi:catechol 2,3-dioxygenase-like lactoylglutathione lyase family enzyme